jgi:hypothetical protein
MNTAILHIVEATKAYNPFQLIFSFAPDSSKVAYGKLAIPAYYMHKFHPLADASLITIGYPVQSGAQRKALRGQEGVYKNMLRSYTAMEGCIMRYE